MAFGGIILIDDPLKIRRPKDHGGSESLGPSTHVPGVVSTDVPGLINKIFVRALPAYLNEEQVIELLKSFGELKVFNLVREGGGGPSKRFAFLEYVDPDVTDVAILHGLVLQPEAYAAAAAIAEIHRPILPVGENQDEARILPMLNVIITELFSKDQEYQDICDDIKEGCGNHGEVLDLRFRGRRRRIGSEAVGPVLSGGANDRRGEWSYRRRVYVKLVDPRAAQEALKALAGRSFSGRSIVVTLLADDSQTASPLNLIFAPLPSEPSASPPLAPLPESKAGVGR